jgi:hypothetical protein
MSQLPQHRKTSEEIARLRESLGVPEVPAAAPPVSAPPPPLPPSHPVHHAPELTPLTGADFSTPSVLQDAKVNHVVKPDTAPPLVLGQERRVHSLKKS